MKCYICDKEISDKEIIFNTDFDGFEPCQTCLAIALEAAYSSGHDDEFDVVVDEAFDDDTYVPPFRSEAEDES